MSEVDPESNTSETTHAVDSLYLSIFGSRYEEAVKEATETIISTPIEQPNRRLGHIPATISVVEYIGVEASVPKEMLDDVHKIPLHPPVEGAPHIFVQADCDVAHRRGNHSIFLNSEKFKLEHSSSPYPVGPRLSCKNPSRIVEFLLTLAQRATKEVAYRPLVRPPASELVDGYLPETSDIQIWRDLYSKISLQKEIFMGVRTYLRVPSLKPTTTRPYWRKRARGLTQYGKLA